MKQTVLTTSRSDADLKTFRGLGLEVKSQLFDGDTQPAAIKINQALSSEEAFAIIAFLKNCTCPVVLDFNSISSTTRDLGEAKRGELIKILPLADILVLNTHEAEIILNRKINTHQSMQEAAKELLSFSITSVFLLGESLHESSWSHDYFTDGFSAFWLTQNRFSVVKYPEIHSVLSATITASLALGHSLQDAIIIAKMYAHQAIRLAQTSLYFGGFPEDERDFPYLSSMPLHHAPQPFKPCHRLGLYPVVDSSVWVGMLLNLGVKTIQLRIKERTKTLEDDMHRSIVLAKKHHATLFINDYWELALKLDAHAVHLGQSDLDTADIDAIRNQGLLLGVSTHCYHEVARAHAICPSYVAIGPIYPTTSKEMLFAAQGIERLHRWQRTLNYPLVAIGGINLERMSDVVATGVQGVALISAITEAEDPRKATKQLLSFIE